MRLYDRISIGDSMRDVLQKLEEESGGYLSTGFQTNAKSQIVITTPFNITASNAVLFIELNDGVVSACRLRLHENNFASAYWWPPDKE